ncbi:MAG TPA: hypothetical protein VKI62_03605, partial [Bacteroidota bacterium]|nr:hypothetical protein [Bacteroidota bacterium]
VDIGPAMIALRNRVPVIWCRMYRNEAHQYRLVLEPVAVSYQSQVMEQDATKLTQLWTNLLVKEIHEHPEQWWEWGNTEMCSKEISSLE